MVLLEVTSFYLAHEGGGWLPVSKLLPVGRFPSEVSYVSKPNERFAWNRYLLKGAGPGIVDGPDPQVKTMIYSSVVDLQIVLCNLACV